MAYHIKKDGTPGVCRAKNGKCPFGGASEHFSSKEAAEEFAQKNFEKEFGVSLTDEPYSSSPICANGELTAYENQLLSNINLDGATIETFNKGVETNYKVNHLKRPISFKPTSKKTDSVNDYLTNATYEREFEVNIDGTVLDGVTEHQLNSLIAKNKDKARLEQVTYSAVDEFNRMDYSSDEAHNLQKRIRENELAGDFVANKSLEEKAFSKKVNDRIMAAESGYHNETLVSDKDAFVRAAVAGNGDEALLEKLKDDKSVLVRSTVADKGYALEQLSNDEHPVVRAAVANKGFNSEKMKDDESWQVREAVANSSKELSHLIKDEHPRVRLAVARNLSNGQFGKELMINDPDPIIRSYLANEGVRPDILINDKDETVSRAAKDYLSKEN